MRVHRGGSAVLAAAAVLVVVAVVTGFVVPHSTSGHGGPPPPRAVVAGHDTQFTALPSAPAEKWKSDARALFGSSAVPKYLMVKAGDDKVAIVAALSKSQGPAPVMAVDTATGRPMWRAAPRFAARGCALSADRKLACVTGDGDSEPQVAFIDLTSGAITATTTVAARGYPDVVRAGDGFLITTAAHTADFASTEVLTWFSSDGVRTWTQTAPKELDNTQLSEAGNVITVAQYDVGARVYRLDTGEVLYDSTADMNAAKAKADDRPTVSVAPNAGGYVVSIVAEVGRESRNKLMIFDSTGVQRAVLPKMKLPLLPDGSEGDLVPVQRSDDFSQNSIGVLSTSQRKVLWNKDADDLTEVSILGGRYLTGKDYTAPGGYTRRLYDARTGRDVSSIQTSIYQDPRGFDGERVFFDGDDREGESGPGAISAYDVRTGARVWRLKIAASADDVNIRLVGQNLYRYDAAVGASPAAITRLG